MNSKRKSLLCNAVKVLLDTLHTMSSKRKSSLCNAVKVLTLCLLGTIQGRVHCVMQLKF